MSVWSCLGGVSGEVSILVLSCLGGVSGWFISVAKSCVGAVRSSWGVLVLGFLWSGEAVMFSRGLFVDS